MNNNKEMIVTCSSCRETYNKEEATVDRPVEGHDKIIEVGLQCPHCDDWIHVHLNCPKLRRFEATLRANLSLYEKHRNAHTLKQYQRARKRYNVEWDRFHEEWRPKLGMVSPSELQEVG